MEIDRNGVKNEVRFDRLARGDVFEYGDEIRLKTDERDEDGDTRCVNLETGTIWHNSPGDMVIPRRAKVVLGP